MNAPLDVEAIDFLNGVVTLGCDRKRRFTGSGPRWNCGRAGRRIVGSGNQSGRIAAALCRGRHRKIVLSQQIQNATDRLKRLLSFGGNFAGVFGEIGGYRFVGNFSACIVCRCTLELFVLVANPGMVNAGDGSAAFVFIFIACGRNQRIDLLGFTLVQVRI